MIDKIIYCLFLAIIAPAIALSGMAAGGLVISAFLLLTNSATPFPAPEWLWMSTAIWFAWAAGLLTIIGLLFGLKAWSARNARR